MNEELVIVDYPTAYMRIVNQLKRSNGEYVVDGCQPAHWGLTH